MTCVVSQTGSRREGKLCRGIVLVLRRAEDAFLSDKYRCYFRAVIALGSGYKYIPHHARCLSLLLLRSHEGVGGSR